MYIANLTFSEIPKTLIFSEINILGGKPCSFYLFFLNLQVTINRLIILWWPLQCVNNSKCLEGAVLNQGNFGQNWQPKKAAQLLWAS